MRYALYLPFNAFFLITAWILALPLAGLSVLFGVNKLWGFLQYWSTIDDDLDGGQHQHPESYPAGVKGKALWWQRTCWICRNPAQGWQGVVLGFKHEGMTVTHEVTEGRPSFGEGNRLYKCTMVDAKGREFWTYRRDVPVGKSHYIRMWYGWHYEAKGGVYHTLKFFPFGWEKLNT